MARTMAVLVVGMVGTAEVMAQMDHGSMQGGSPPPDARDPHAYSGGLTFGSDRQLRMMDEESHFTFMMDRLESVRTDDDNAAAFELKARYGRDYDRGMLKAEGHVAHGVLEEGSAELLWSHAVSAYWDTQLGVRHDRVEGGPNRNWLAFGFAGLAPYWLEIDASAYLGEEGRSALRLEAEYELLFTQKLVLQPRFELSAFGKRDETLGLGSGIAEGALGLRLRYEIKREFAPYIGVERAVKFGGTADMARAVGSETAETRWVAGLRFWY